MTARAGGGLVYFLVILMTLLMRISGSAGVYDAIGVDPDVFFTLIVQLCCFGLLPVLGWLIIVGGRGKDELRALPRTFNVVKCGKRDFLRTLAITVPVLFVTGFVSYVWNGALSLMGYERSSSAGAEQTAAVLVSDIFLTAVLPALFEELTHRGEVFATYRDSGWKVIPVSALLFSLMHQNIPQTGHTFAMGICLGVMTYYSGSLLPAVFVHFFNNFISVVSGYSGLVPVFGVIDTVSGWLYGTVFGVVIACLIAAASVAFIAFMLGRMRKDAVRCGRLSEAKFAPAAEGALPLSKDIMLWFIIAVGVVATLFSFVWGIM